jgi:hypothetical protein
MSKRKGLDLENLKFIDATEVPAKVRYTPYRDILRRIRKGKALVVSDKDMDINTMRAGVQRLKNKGEFKWIILVQRTMDNGEQVLYVVNPSNEEKEKKLELLTE